MHLSEERSLAGRRTQHNAAVMPLNRKGRSSFSHIKKKTNPKPNNTHLTKLVELKDVEN